MSPDSKSRRYTPVPPAIVDKVENILGFVALIDVLGFRELVGRDNDLSQVRDYVDTVATHLEDDKYSQLQFVLFSDNLVINTRNDSRDSFLTLIRACAEIFFELARRQIAVRGAVAHGTFMRSPNTRQGVVVAGRPIVEADHYQHSQNWVGIMLAPSVVRRDSEALQKECEAIPERQADEAYDAWLKRISLTVHLRKWLRIPFHVDDSAGKSSFEGFAVLPIRSEASSPSAIVQSLGNTLKYLEMMKSVAPNPASQDKYSESVEFLRSIKDQWQYLAENK